MEAQPTIAAGNQSDPQAVRPCAIAQGASTTAFTYSLYGLIRTTARKVRDSAPRPCPRLYTRPQYSSLGGPSPGGPPAADSSRALRRAEGPARAHLRPGGRRVRSH
eukprot:704548-Hanusia_phi.AAC.1